MMEGLVFRALWAGVPIALALILLVPLRRPAYQAMPLAWLAAALIASVLWRMPMTWIVAATVNGVLTAMTILVIVFGALLLLNTLRKAGALSVISASLLQVTTDRRIQALLIGFGFATLVEGTSGFGTPAALAAPLLVGIGFPPLAAAATALIGHAPAVSFGAVGTPILGGVGAALDVAHVREALPVPFLAWITGDITVWNANFHFLGGALIVPLLVVTSLTVWFGRRGEWKRALEAWPMALAAGTAFAVTQNALARLTGPELPSIGGGLAAMLVVVLFAQRRWLQPKVGWGFPDDASGGGARARSPGEPAGSMSLLWAWLPYVLVIVLLLVTRLVWLPFRELFVAPSITWPGILGTELTWSWDFLYSPGVFPFTVVAAASWGLFRMGLPKIRRSVVVTVRQLAAASLAMGAAVAMAQIMMHSGNNALGVDGMLVSLADASARLVGGAFPMVSPWIGALGSFMSGSNTVSNIIFSGYQYQVAAELGYSRTLVVSLQSAGAAVGNIMTVHNLVAVLAVVGGLGKEGLLLRMNALAFVSYLLAVGALGMLAVWLFGAVF